MSQQRRAEVADTDEERFVDVIPAEKGFDRLDEFRDGITGLGFPDDSGVLEIFAHLDGDEIEVTADKTARYSADSFDFKFAQIVVILGETVEAWLGNTGGAARLRTCMNR